MQQWILRLKMTLLLTAASTLTASQVLPIEQEPPPAVVTVSDTAPTPKDVSDNVEKLIDAAKTGSWIGIAAAIITLMVSLFKLPLFGELIRKIPKRFRLVVPVVLGGIAGLLGNILGGMSWPEALYLGLFSGPTAIFAHEAVVHAIFGKRRTAAA